MNFSIFDSGNLVASYINEQDAVEALSELVQDDPEGAEQLVLIGFDDTDEPAGEPVVGSSIAATQPV